MTSAALPGRPESLWIAYLLGLASRIPGDGSHVFEESAAIDVRDARPAWSRPHAVR